MQPGSGCTCKSGSMVFGRHGRAETAGAPEAARQRQEKAVVVETEPESLSLCCLVRTPAAEDARSLLLRRSNSPDPAAFSLPGPGPGPKVGVALESRETTVVEVRSRAVQAISELQVDIGVRPYHSLAQERRGQHTRADAEPGPDAEARRRDTGTDTDRHRQTQTQTQTQAQAQQIQVLLETRRTPDSRCALSARVRICHSQLPLPVSPLAAVSRLWLCPVSAVLLRRSWSLSVCGPC